MVRLALALVLLAASAEPGEPLWRVVAYCACPECCPPPRAVPGITASGRRPVAGLTLACPESLALGTWLRLTVPGVRPDGSAGVRLMRCDDRGQAIVGRTLDLYHDSHAEAVRWGVRSATVEVLHADR
jgi:3D (Asp-Asp-Asp) domain-containing protein